MASALIVRYSTQGKLEWVHDRLGLDHLLLCIAGLLGALVVGALMRHPVPEPKNFSLRLE